MRRRGFFGRRLISSVRGERGRTRPGIRRALMKGQRLLEDGEYVPDQQLSVQFEW